MEKSSKAIVAMLIGLLQFTLAMPLTADAQNSAGVYNVNVTTPGTFGQVMLRTVDNWSDVVELTITGHLNSSDMAYFSRMQNMTKLDISQTDASSISGCTDLTRLKEVVLPKSVTTIEGSTFWDCSSLSGISFDQIEEIGSYAFYGCINLTGSINLAKVKTVGEYAFKNCSSISAIEMPIATEIGYCAFQYCTKLESVNITNCHSLRSGCFSSCSSLSTVILSDDLEEIPDYAFEYTNLKSITLPTGLKNIGQNAFYSSYLENISIPEGVKSVDYLAFEGCPLENITLPSTLEFIGDAAFGKNKKIYDSSTGKYKDLYVLKNVYCNIVTPILTRAFDNDKVKTATLHVPAFSVAAYKLDEYWYKFNKTVAIDGDLSDITIHNTFTIVDYTGIANNANLNLSYSEETSTSAHLTISAEAPLSLNKFIQYQYFKPYYDEFQGGLYYPYCTTLITDNEARANSVLTKMMLPANQWSFISMPYDVNVSSIVAPKGTMWVVRRYNGANRAAMSGETWENVSAGQILNTGEGYIFHCINIDDNSNPWETEYFEFEFPAINNSNKNNIFSYNDVTKSIKEFPAEFSHNRGWNLIGNPYPAYLNSHYIDFPAPITVWNGGGYTAYSLTDDDYVLHPNEAFFVQCPINTNQIKFLKGGRTHSYSSYAISPRAKALSANSRSIFNFILSNEEYSDRVRLVVNESALCDYEIERDASKFMSSNATVPQIYIIDNGVNYAIDERPLGAGEYSLGVRIGKEGTYTIALNSISSDYDIILIDKESNETIDLTMSSYQFESTPQTISSRFVVKVAPKGGELSSIDDITVETVGFSVTGHQISFTKDIPVSIYSIDGKLVYHGIATEAIELPSGIYLLYMNNTTHKIAIK